MSMANRNDSDSRQHETLPGPGPGTNASKGGKSTGGNPIGGSPVGGSGRPVEQVMDAAIERIAREREHPIELARRSAGDAHLARREGTQLPVPREPTRLRWKGLDVSEEFRQYADRVARGEQLPPFEGRVLAEPNPAFPWGEAAVADEPTKKRGSHPVIWGAAIVFLGLLGWSLVLQVQGSAARDSGQSFSQQGSSEQSAALETSVAPLAPTPSATELPAIATPHDVTPHDVVQTASLGAQSPTLLAPSVSSTEPTGPDGAAAADPSVKPPPPAAVAATVPALASPAVASPAPSPAPTGASIAVDLARAGALQQAVGAALAARNGAAPPAQSNPTPRDDEFGIMASVSPAPVAAAPAPPAATAPAGAKSTGNVGDLSRASQPSAPGVRKEPGSESSAKGSLLVETPSF